MLSKFDFVLGSARPFLSVGEGLFFSIDEFRSS